MSARLQLWTVYDHPRDFPDCFVARRFDGEQATDETISSPSLDELRGALEAIGLVPLARMDGDDPAIVETWF